MNRYSLYEIIKNLIALLHTKLFFKDMKLVRLPVYIRGKKSIYGGKRLTIGYNCRFDLDGAKKTLFIGSDCQFGDNTHIVALNHVEIGNNVLIASKVFISDTNHGLYNGIQQSSPYEAPSKRILEKKDVFIGDNVWIGENSVIFAGTIVNSGAIIGANSVVKGIVEENTIVVGSPATVVKRFNIVTKKWERNK